MQKFRHSGMYNGGTLAGMLFREGDQIPNGKPFCFESRRTGQRYFLCDERNSTDLGKNTSLYNDSGYFYASATCYASCNCDHPSSQISAEHLDELLDLQLSSEIEAEPETSSEI